MRRRMNRMTYYGEVIDMLPGKWRFSMELFRDYYDIKDKQGEFDGAGIRISTRTLLSEFPALSENEYEKRTNILKYKKSIKKVNEQELLKHFEHNKKSISIKVLSIPDIFALIALYLEEKDAINLAATCNIMKDDRLWEILHNYHFGHIENLVKIECSSYFPPRENNWRNQYIIRKSMRWGKHSREYQLSNNGLTVKKTFNIDSPISNRHNVFAEVGLFSGKHYWEVHLDRYYWPNWSPFLLIGIVPADGKLDECIGWNGNGCSYTSNGTYFCEELGEVSWESPFLYHKDTIGVYLDLDTFSIKFFLNGVDLGWAFRDFNKHRKWKLPVYPAVGTAHSEDQFTINFNVPPPKHDESIVLGRIRWDLGQNL